MDKSSHRAFLEEVRHDIALLEQQLSTLREIESYHAAKAGSSLQSGGKAVGAVASENGFAGMKTRDAVQVILSRAGEPMSTRDIADALLKGGFQTKNPDGLRNAVFSMLARETELFEKAGKGRWVLKMSS